MSNPTVAKIVTDYLKANAYDGLFNTDGECGCKVDDLCPCNAECVFDCEAGYVGRCEDEDVNGWAIFRTKQPPGDHDAH